MVPAASAEVAVSAVGRKGVPNVTSRHFGQSQSPYAVYQLQSAGTVVCLKNLTVQHLMLPLVQNLRLSFAFWVVTSQPSR